MKMSRSTALTAVLVVLALVVGSLLDSWLPSADSADGVPFTHAAGIGEAVPLRTHTVTVDGIAAGTEVASYGAVTGTTAHWLVVSYTVEAVGQSASFPPAFLRLRAADGRLFGETPGTIVACGPAQPGIPLRCTVPFEVPADALAGAHLLVPAGIEVGLSDDLADIDLGITAADAATLAASTARIDLPEPQVGG